MTLAPGLQGRVSTTVGDDDTAVARGSGDVEVWATPSVVALCEAAAVATVADALDETETTVGVRIDLEHSAPTPPGAAVSATATLDAVDGRRLAFTVEASDGAGVVARGTHQRVRLDRERFLQGARERTEPGSGDSRPD